MNLFSLPSCGYDDWVSQVSGNPKRARTTEIRVSKVGDVPKDLFKVFQRDHAVSTDAAIRLFDEYLLAVCPQCLRGLTGHNIQMAGFNVNAKEMGARAILGGGPVIQRTLENLCVHCDSQTYRAVWLGDGNQGSGTRESTEKLEQERRKWWQLWK